MRPATVWISVLMMGVLSHCSASGRSSPDPARVQSSDTTERLTQTLRDTAPEDRPNERDRLAARQATAAIALLRLRRSDAVWPLLRLTADPSARTYLVHALARSGIDPALLVQRLDVERESSIRRALILSLGQYTNDRLPPGQRRPLIGKLLQWYRDDPDAGVHSAIDWLLRPNRQGDRPRILDWEQRDALAAIDRELAGRPANGRQWFVNRDGMTMVVIAQAAEFRMGSPAYEAGRVPASDSPDEAMHSARIPRSFAVASREVIVGEFRRFLDAIPDVKARFAYADNPARMQQVLRRFSPDENGPQIAVTWYEAAMYCNWLSQREGIPEQEWVYPSRFADFQHGMRLPGGYLHRRGYRLPTEAEWEYAARAGTTSPRFFGISDSLLGEFAWYSRHPPKTKSDPVDPNDPPRTWPVGQLEPNDFGLFDVYGNVWEWTQSRVLPYPVGGVVHEDVEDQVLVVSDSAARVRRGGGFSYEAAMMRSAERGTVTAFPYLRRDNVGFRIARTLSP
ncbi:MAG: formylglycine-generating enzyme family protein [Gemmatimonadaceae bacterium]